MPYAAPALFAAPAPRTHALVPVRPAMVWYVGFCDMQGKSALRPFTRRGFGHVFAFTATNSGILVVEPVGWGLSLHHAKTPKGEACYPVDIMAADFLTNIPNLTLLEVRLARAQVPSARHVSNMVPTCVSVVKTLLGVRTWAQTPWQLYGFLRGEGATHITHSWCNRARNVRVRQMMNQYLNPNQQQEI